MSESTWFANRTPLVQPLEGDYACLSKIDDEGLRTYASLLIHELRAAFPDQGSIEVHVIPSRKGKPGYSVCLRLPTKPPDDKARRLMVRLADAVPSDMAGRLAGCLTWDKETQERHV